MKSSLTILNIIFTMKILSDLSFKRVVMNRQLIKRLHALSWSIRLKYKKVKLNDSFFAGILTIAMSDHTGQCHDPADQLVDP